MPFDVPSLYISGSRALKGRIALPLAKRLAALAHSTDIDHYKKYDYVGRTSDDIGFAIQSKSYVANSIVWALIQYTDFILPV